MTLSDNFKFRSDKVCLNTRDFKMPQPNDQATEMPFPSKNVNRNCYFNSQ